MVGLITIGTDLATSEQAIDTAANADAVWATVGVHPHDASAGGQVVTDSDDWRRLEALFERPEVVAVGECGLDYHYDHSPRPEQREVFAAHIALANTLDLPLVIHTREAWDDTFRLLDVEGVPATTIFHCFTGGPAEADQCLAREAYLSFSGIVTFKNADDVRDAARRCPNDRLLVETDSPYLTPVPHRGQPNRPALVAVVGAAIADTIGRSVAEVAASTTANARRAFRL